MLRLDLRGLAFYFTKPLKPKQHGKNQNRRARIQTRLLNGSGLQLRDHEQSDGNLKPIAQLGYCMLAASNKETDVPEFHDFVGSLDTIDKIAEFRTAFEQALAEFFGADKSVDPSKQEDAAKNA